MGEDGRVSELEVRSGGPPFDLAARSAVAKWTFAPAMRDNIPVKSRVLIKVSFTSPQPEPEPQPGTPTSRPATPPPRETPGQPPANPPPAQITLQGERAQDLAAIHRPPRDTRPIPRALAHP